jgi:flavorubredoxin
MRALVVYESMFGNTQRVATAIASALATSMETSLVEVGDAADLHETDFGLVVVGAPTHAFSLSRSESRKNAAKKTDGPVISTEVGLRDWIRRQHASRALAAAAFDTRFKMSRKLTGSAARSAEKKLKKRGFDLVVPAESFFVEGEHGPLHVGEQERAYQWSETLHLKLVTAG